MRIASLFIGLLTTVLHGYGNLSLKHEERRFSFFTENAIDQFYFDDIFVFKYACRVHLLQ